MNVNRNLLLVLATLIIIVFTVGVQAYRQLNPPPPPTVVLMGEKWIGKPAPQFELKDEKDGIVKTSDYFGKYPTFVVFHLGTQGFHTIADVLQLSGSAERIKKGGAQVLFVSNEDPKRSRMNLNKWTDRTNSRRIDKPFHFLWDPIGEVADKFGALSKPGADGGATFMRGSVFVVDLKGRITYADITQSAKQRYNGSLALLALDKMAKESKPVTPYKGSAK